MARGKKGSSITKDQLPEDMELGEGELEDGDLDDGDGEDEGDAEGTPLDPAQKKNAQKLGFREAVSAEVNRTMRMLLKRLPGGKKLLDSMQPEKAKNKAIATSAFVTHMDTNKEPLGDLHFSARGPLGREYHSRFFHIVGPGKIEGVPEKVGKALEKDHPLDFGFKAFESEEE